MSIIPKKLYNPASRNFGIVSISAITISMIGTAQLNTAAYAVNIGDWPICKRNRCTSVSLLIAAYTNSSTQRKTITSSVTLRQEMDDDEVGE